MYEKDLGRIRIGQSAFITVDTYPNQSFEGKVAYISDVLHLQPGQIRLLPYYTSVSVVRALGDLRMVGGIADTAHLE